MSGRLTRKTALDAALRSADGRYAVLLERGTLELGYYVPRGSDPQTPHDQDELYIVLSGSGTFLNNGVRQPFAAGEALFVAAGVEHRFCDFTDDIEAWVVFYGPPGGEQPA